VTRDLVVLGSGDPAALGRCGPVFVGFARSWHDLGPFGNGTKVKLLANLLVVVHNLAAETLLLAKRAGLDPVAVLPVLADGAGGSRMLEVRGPAMVAGSYEPAAMRVQLFKKDLDLIEAFAREHQSPTPLLEASARWYLEALDQGRAEQDTACLLAVLEAVPIAARLELSRAGHRDLPRQYVAAAHPEVAGRPDVQATELEDEEHLRRPTTDAPNG
jgi:3-hydroxyisobutyrate dehydrogenase-like beta-hydroxyacid dehydrogenase